MALKFGPDIVDQGREKGTRRGKKLSAFGKAFKLAYDTKPGSTFTFGGKEYKAIKKQEGKGPLKSRVEDNSISAGTIIKGKRDTTKKPLDKTYIVDGKKVSALSKQDALKKAGSIKKKATNAAGQRMGQRKAGGIIKAGKGSIIAKALKKLAPPLSKKGKVLTKSKATAAADKQQRALDRSIEKLQKTIDKKFPPLSKLAPPLSKRGRLTNAISKNILYKNKKKVIAAALVTAAALPTKDKNKIVENKRKEKKNVSQSDIIGKGSKKGRMAGGMMKKYTKGGMNKYNKGSMVGDLDKDGVMSGYEQKRQNAITKAMGNKKMGGGMAKKKMMGGGMMQYSKGTGKKGATVQARGCGLARKKPTKMS